MKNPFGFGSDGIVSHFIDIASPVISQSHCSIFNFSMNTGKFPDSCKTTRLAPIFKSGKRDDLSNYRPISNLPDLLRLFKRLVYDQLYNHLDKKSKHLDTLQSNFRVLLWSQYVCSSPPMTGTSNRL